MNHTALRRPLALALISLVGWAGSLQPAQAQTQTQSRAEQMSGALVAVCPKMIEQLAGRPEMALVLGRRPIDPAVVCGCTQTLFVADERLQAVFNLPQETLQERMKSQNLRSYVFVRLTHSVLACLNVELEASLVASNPAE